MDGSDFDWVCKRPFGGDATAVLKRAAQALQARGFRVSTHDLQVEGLGTGRGVGTRNPFAGATRVRVSCGAEGLTLEAVFGGVERAERRLFASLAAVGLLLGGFFELLFGEHGWGLVLTVTVAPLFPWAVCIPGIARKLRKRTIQALEELLAGVATPVMA